MTYDIKVVSLIGTLLACPSLLPPNGKSLPNEGGARRTSTGWQSPVTTSGFGSPALESVDGDIGPRMPLACRIQLYPLPFGGSRTESLPHLYILPTMVTCPQFGIMRNADSSEGDICDPLAVKTVIA